MPYRPHPYAPIPTYRAYHVNAATSQPAAAGMLLDATGSAVSVAGSATANSNTGTNAANAAPNDTPDSHPTTTPHRRRFRCAESDPQP